MRYYLAPVLAPASPSPDPDVESRDYWRLSLDDLAVRPSFSAVIPTHVVTGLPLFSWGIAYVQSEDWSLADADPRLIRLFQGEEGAERSFGDVQRRLVEARWNLLTSARQQAISQPLRQRGVPASVFQTGSLWELLQRIGRGLDPNFDAGHTHVNRGTVLVRPDPTVGQDTFTETSNTVLSSHTPDVGAGWTLEVANSYTVLGTTDVLRHDNAADEMARKGDDIGDDDMDVSMAVTTQATGTARKFGVCGRMTTADFNNAYQAYHQAADPSRNLFLFKEVAGVRTQLGTSTAVANGTVKLEIRTAAKKVYLDGVEKISDSGDVLVGNNYAGIFANGSTNTGNSGDNFLSESVAAAVTGHGGLHHIWHGIGDPGVAVVPQTLHTIEQGIAT